MEPIKLSFPPGKKEIITLDVVKGPSMHAIANALCPSIDEHWYNGVTFQVTLPYEEFGRRGKTDVWWELILTEFKAIDVHAERITLGACLKNENGKIDGWRPLVSAPLQITSYSTKSRCGHIQLPYHVYEGLFKKQEVKS